MKPLEAHNYDLKNYVLALLFCSIAKNNSGSGHVIDLHEQHFTLSTKTSTWKVEFIGYPTGS